LRRAAVALCALATACGSTSAPTTEPAPTATAATLDGEAARTAELQRRAALAADHRKLEDQASTALAATCLDPEAKGRGDRCLPSCYRGEAADPRAGKQLARGAEVQHLVCELRSGAYLLADELMGSKLTLKPVKKKLPKPHKKGSWEFVVESALATMFGSERAKGDVIRVTGKWKSIAHPATKAKMRCVMVSHYMRSMRRALDRCGSQGTYACEATGNDAVHGINVVHYRLAEARRLEADGKLTECQQASLEAVAVARGMPRWRQYMQLNVDKWMSYERYRTRFDGTLDEDTLFTTAIAMGVEAEAVYVSCGGPAQVRTTPEQEQSFHTCW